MRRETPKVVADAISITDAGERPHDTSSSTGCVASRQWWLCSLTS